MAILVGHDRHAGLFFLLEFRALAQNDEKVVLNTGPTKVCRDFRQGILFCPWCGTELRLFYSGLENSLPLLAPEEVH